MLIWIWCFVSHNQYYSIFILIKRMLNLDEKCVLGLSVFNRLCYLVFMLFSTIIVSCM